MFPFKTCSHPSCHTYVACCSETCYRHSPEKERLHAFATMKLESQEVVKDLCITDAEFEDIVLPGKKEIIASNFAWSTFRHVDFSHAELISSFFDFCLFEDCRFKDIDCRYCVFSGSEFLTCDFSGSFIVHSNFSGITSIMTSFASSDLYFSAFPT
ncbi:MAG: pentapeptide repeat-containing protein, partial [Sphaerochaetaceae bacterium]